MKNIYLTPVVSVFFLSNEDVVRTSGDIDVTVNGTTYTNTFLGNGERGVLDGLQSQSE